MPTSCRPLGTDPLASTAPLAEHPAKSSALLTYPSSPSTIMLRAASKAYGSLSSDPESGPKSVKPGFGYLQLPPLPLATGKQRVGLLCVHQVQCKQSRKSAELQSNLIPQILGKPPPVCKKFPAEPHPLSHSIICITVASKSPNQAQDPVALGAVQVQSKREMVSS